MPTVTETITVTSTGANNYTRTYPVLVDVATGTGVLSIPLTSTNAGTDTITASMTSHSPLFTSNPVQVAWYGPTTLLPVPSVIETPEYILQSSAPSGHPRPWDGDIVTNHPGNVCIVYYNDIHDRPGPDQSLINAFNSATGAYVYLSGGTTPATYTDGPFHAPPGYVGGCYKVTGYGADKPYHDTQDTHNWFTFTCGGPALGLFANYGAAAVYQQAILSSVLAPPAGTPGAAQLRLTPVATGSNNWQPQASSYSLTLNIQNVTYTTIPYIPLLEGTAGSLNLFDSGSVFNFGGVTYNGSSPDYTSALAVGAVNLMGDNTAWQGLLSITPSGTSPTGHLTGRGGRAAAGPGRCSRPCPASPGPG